MKAAANYIHDYERVAPKYGSMEMLMPTYGPVPAHYCRECEDYRAGGICISKRNFFGGITSPLHSADKCRSFRLRDESKPCTAPLPLTVSATNRKPGSRRKRGPYRRREEMWEIMTRTEKRCKQCGELKPLEEYNEVKRNSRHLDGHADVCKACMEENKRLSRIKAVATMKAHGITTRKASAKPAAPAKSRKLSWAGKRIKEMTIEELREYKRVNTANFHARHHHYPADPTPDTRICVKCGRTLPLTDFHKCRCGYTHTCNACTSENLSAAAKKFHKRQNHKV